MRRRCAGCLVWVLVWMWVACAPTFAGSAGTAGSTTTSTTSTTTINVGTVNAGSVYQGTVTVTGAMNATVLYTWGQVRASRAVIDSLATSLTGSSPTALQYFANAVQTLPSNLELLTACAPLNSPFLYYTSGNGTGFEPATAITDGANALGVELQAIGGRTARWSSTVSGPSNFAYALTASTRNETTTTSPITVGDFVVAQTVASVDRVTTYSGTAEVSVYQVEASKFVSPLVLDLTGSGRLQASGGDWLPHPNKLHRERVIAFDFNANGFEMLMEWVGPDDGLLVEPNADGSVDGSCLFGTTGGYCNGFEKLALRDANHDGKLTGHELDGLFVWQDRNGNGRIEEGELRSVHDLRITELDLNHYNFRSAFVMNGVRRLMWDWWPSALQVRKVRLSDLR